MQQGQLDGALKKLGYTESQASYVLSIHHHRAYPRDRFTSFELPFQNVYTYPMLGLQKQRNMIIHTWYAEKPASLKEPVRGPNESAPPATDTKKAGGPIPESVPSFYRTRQVYVPHTKIFSFRPNLGEGRYFSIISPSKYPVGPRKLTH